MSTPLHPDPETIALAGDWHGNLPWALKMITFARDNGATMIVHLGDFGFWRADPGTRKYLARTTRLLEQLDMKLIFVDGNHEDHTRLDALPIDPDNGLREISDRIWHLPRGFRWSWHGQVWMALGGAHSVDRSWRVEGKSWWPREFLSYAEIEHAKRAGRVDVMVTHDCPDGVDVPSLRGPSEWPEFDLACSLAHRQMLGDVVRTVRPSVLYHGHHHCRYDDVLRQVDGTATVVHGLDCDESTPQANVTILDLTGAAKA